MKGRFLPLILCLTLATVQSFSQGEPISPVIMGKNYHYAKWKDPAGSQLNIFGDPLWYGSQSNNTVMAQGVKPSNCVFLRIGGKQFNISDHKPDPGQEVYYVSLIDDARRNGMEPVLTLPFLLDEYNDDNVGEHVEPHYNTTDFSDAVAASINTLQAILHLVNTVHKRNLRYVILGNEPDYDYWWTTDWPTIQQDPGSEKAQHTQTCGLSPKCGATDAQTVALNIANYIKPMANAVRAMEQEMGVTMHIIGPEYTHCLPEVYDFLFTPTNTATYIGGINQTTQKPYLNSASVHFYGPDFDDSPQSFEPPPPSSWTPSLTFCNLERYAKKYWEPKKEARKYRGAMHYMKTKTAECNADRGSQQPPLGWMITEMNSGHRNEFDPTPGTAALAAVGEDAISMQGAQNLTRMYSLAMEYGIPGSVMLWSIQESGEHQDRGYLVGQGTTDKGKKRPSWFHYKMLADYFKGTYYRDEVFANHKGVSSSGTPMSISDYETALANNTNGIKTHTATFGPQWLHYRSSSTETATIGSQTFALNTPSAYNAHFEKMCETKAFAAKGADIAVMILNHSASHQTVVIRFDGVTTFTSAAAQNAKRFSFNINSNASEVILNTALGGGWDAAIDANSTHVIIFDCNGGVKERYRYRLGTEASTYNQIFTKFYSPSASYSIVATASSPTLCLSNPAAATIAVSGAPANSSYTWYRPPATQPIASGTSSVLSLGSNMMPGLHRVVVSHANLCGGSYTTDAVLHLTSPLVDAGEDVEFCGSSTTAVLGNTAMPSGGYTWQPGGTNNATLQVNTISVSSTTVFTLEASDGAGCKLADQVHVNVKSDIGVMIRDELNDKGDEPNVTLQSLWSSPDIWCNYSPGTTNQFNSQIQPNTTAYVKVRVHNNGCDPLPANELLVKVYYTASAPAVNTWPTGWLNYPCSNLLPQNLCAFPPPGTCGDLIGTQTNTQTIPVGGSAVVEFTWSVPQNHYCPYTHKQAFKNVYLNNWSLQAHVSHSLDPLPTLTHNVHYNLYKSNNIALRNVLILSPGTSTIPTAIYVRNDDDLDEIRLDFMSLRDYNNESVLNYADVFMYFPGDFLERWIVAGENGEGIVPLSDTSVQIISEHAYMDNFPMFTDEIQLTGLSVVPFADVDMSGGEYFMYDVVQRPAGYEDSITGGFRYEIEKDSWTCPDCDEPEGFQQSYSSMTLVEDDSVHVQNDITVSNGETMRFERSVLKFAEDVKITVEEGGKLILKNCVLEAACHKQTWEGIKVNGDSLAVNSLTVESCVFRDTYIPLTATKAKGLLIRKNAFIGLNDYQGTAITLDSCGVFDLSQNQLARFKYGISTAATYSATSESRIERNIFQAMEVCLKSFKDKHLNTSIRCNSFGYKNYAVLSDSSDLRNFGTQNEGSGNRFRSKSTLANHKINHNSGNSPAYYYNPGQPDSTGMNISTGAAGSNRDCYGSSGSSRIMALVVQEQEAIGISVVPNPGFDETTIRVELGSAEEGKITIRDVQGRFLSEHKVSREKNAIVLDLRQAARGVYFATLQLNSGEKVHTKILVQE